MKLITFVCRMLNNEPLNSIDCVDVLDGLAEGDRATFDTYFLLTIVRLFPGRKRELSISCEQSSPNRKTNWSLYMKR